MGEVHIIYCNKCGLEKDHRKENRARGPAMIELETGTTRGGVHLCFRCWLEFEKTLTFREDEE